MRRIIYTMFIVLYFCTFFLHPFNWRVVTESCKRLCRIVLSNMTFCVWWYEFVDVKSLYTFVLTIRKNKSTVYGYLHGVMFSKWCRYLQRHKPRPDTTSRREVIQISIIFRQQEFWTIILSSGIDYFYFDFTTKVRPRVTFRCFFFSSSRYVKISFLNKNDWSIIYYE